jgi:hypothetical protein
MVIQHVMEQHWPASITWIALPHNIIEIFRVTDNDGRLLSFIVVLNGCRIRATLIDGDFPREPLPRSADCEAAFFTECLKGLSGMPENWLVPF